ncbi:MAG TPA: fused MFS/spermidine synthase [Bryobacteraceae bacterium]|jgi:SAM-dependent methyltransferase|nr:fused MFS/spermidine synthase [Bryobacteraceae bacterium]
MAWLFAGTIFLSAYLLFLVQPLIARVILPWFGGAAAVWATCLMFFQLTLLAGYLYAHASIRYLRPRRQATLHLCVLALSLYTVLAAPAVHPTPLADLHPIRGILALLTVMVGVPYFVLSTTSPLAQAWYAEHNPGRPAYRLYALSNAGSFLALLTYPAAIEPVLHVRAQMWLWRAGYSAFAVACGILTVRAAWNGKAKSSDGLSAGAESPRLGDRLLWAGLAFCPSALLVAVTTHMTQNIAPIPLLWVAPLALYLLSFILTFEGSRWYSRRIWLPAFIIAAALITALLFPDARNASVKTVIPLFSAGFFCCAMTCHGELYRLRPSARHLTAFYLMIAAGGAAGGLFVGIASPLLFNNYLELPIALLVAVILVMIALRRAAPSLPGPHGRLIEYALTGALASGLIYLVAWEDPHWAAGYRVIQRNFYGVLRVEDVDADDGAPEMRQLHHGTINHGAEFLRADWHRRPTTYYGPKSGVGLAIRAALAPRRVGIIGLGAGTLAAYAAPGDTFRFYEINPLVVDIARSQFYFLRECPARVDIVMGDARLSLEREQPQNYDVLAVDAFSGDSIPVHLLTVEAFREYFRHLKPEGVLAVHVSNKYLELAKVVAEAARALNKHAILINNDSEKEQGIYTADWVLLATDPNLFAMPQWIVADRDPLPDPVRREWTDDYSSILGILK